MTLKESLQMSQKSINYLHVKLKSRNLWHNSIIKKKKKASLKKSRNSKYNVCKSVRCI